MSPSQQTTGKLYLALGLGVVLLLCGCYGAFSESELHILAFYGSLMGLGLFLMVYSAILWRRTGTLSPTE